MTDNELMVSRATPDVVAKKLAAGLPLTGVEICRHALITYRQLDYWARTGLLAPSVCEARGSGTKRLYSPADARKARIISRLLDAGISLQSVRGALSLLDDVDDGRWLYAGSSIGVCTDEGLHEALRGGGLRRG